MHPTSLVIIYCVLVILASLAGGWLPTLIKLTHLRMQMMMSLVSGIMLGVALLHMLPHSFQYSHSIKWTAGSMLAGLLVMFFLLRLFHVHHHGDMTEEPHDHDHGDDLQHEHAHEHSEHAHVHSDHAHNRSEHSHVDSEHAHEHGNLARTDAGQRHRLSWLGLFFGLTVHTLLDGVALSASVVAGASHSHVLLGFGTFLVVVLHKPLDALAITSLMESGGWSASSQAMVNLGFSLTCPIGAMLFLLGASRMTEGQGMLLGITLGFSAGFFLCIALSDLLPEVAFHSHDRFKLTTALLLGVAIAIAIESLHTHDFAPREQRAPQSPPALSNPQALDG